MKVQTSAGTYFIDWHHQPTDGADESVSYVSQCILKNEAMEPIKNGLAWCSVKDNFCRAKGRKVSLARAIKIFDKPVRAEIWKAYLDRKVKDGSNN